MKGFVFKGNLGELADQVSTWKFLFQFLLKIEIRIWDLFFDLTMKRKIERNWKLNFIFKQKMDYL